MPSCGGSSKWLHEAELRCHTSSCDTPGDQMIQGKNSPSLPFFYSLVFHLFSLHSNLATDFIWYEHSDFGLHC